MTLFKYKTERGAARALDVLRKAYPDTTFTLGLWQDWMHRILATKPNGSKGWVKRMPLSKIGKDK